MIARALEVRDRHTLIPCLAIVMSSYWTGCPRFEALGEVEKRLLRRVGYNTDQPSILFGRMVGGPFFHDPMMWASSPRTMRVAHQAIIARGWNKWSSGDVVDVEYFLGETTTVKKPEA